MIAVSSIKSGRERPTKDMMSSLVPRHFILARTGRYHKCALYNVLPSDLTNESAFASEKCRLFAGDLVLEEYIDGSNDNRLPRYMMKFEWNTNNNRNVFCQTEIVDNIHKWNETISGGSLDRFKIMMQCSKDRYVLLELQIYDIREERRFRDVVCRINDEFEIWAEVMGD